MTFLWTVFLSALIWAPAVLGNNAFVTPCQTATKEARAELAYCNPELDINKRVDDFIRRLTLKEKAKLMQNTAASVPNLNVSAYEWWNEALHGVGRSPGVFFQGDTPSATSFPQVLVSASSFNTTLFGLLGEFISTEARAMHNVGHAGLTFWTPNVNVFRDPRWGRGQETPGEDPKLTSDYAEQFVRGMQESKSVPGKLKVSSCCKHYYGYDLENYGGFNRMTFDAIISPQDATETYLPPFQACVVKADASSVMCSYNANNGKPSCADNWLLGKLLRDTWHFDGYVTGDCSAVQQVLTGHHYSATPEQSIAAVLDAGLNLDCGGEIPANLENAVEKGIVPEAVVDNRLAGLVRVQMRLGMFDPIEYQPFRFIGLKHIRSPRHVQLAREAAEQGIVLLKNSNNALPLKPERDCTSIGVIGVLANDTNVMLGNYFGDPPHVSSVLEGVSEFCARDTSSHVVNYARGVVHISDKSKDEFPEAIQLAQSSSVVVVTVGIDQSIEAEGKDRSSIDLPGSQEELAVQVAKAAKENKSTVILVVVAGGSLDVGFAKHSSDFDVIIWSGYAGEAAGSVLADIMFGVVSPSGRLTQTLYPREYAHKISMLDMRMRPDVVMQTPGRGYRFYTDEPVYAFGSGMSYATFTHQVKSVKYLGSSQTLVSHTNSGFVINCLQQDVVAMADSINGGDRNQLSRGKISSVEMQFMVHHRNEDVIASEVLLVYLENPVHVVQETNGLQRKLIGYGRTGALSPGFVETLSLKFSIGELALVDNNGKFYAVPHENYRIVVEGTGGKRVHVATLRIVTPPVSAAEIL